MASLYVRINAAPFLVCGPISSLESRMGSRSTLFTSQLPLEDWHKTIDNKTVADAFMDRVVNSSHEIKLKGESLRAAQGLRSKTSSRKTPASS